MSIHAGANNEKKNIANMFASVKGEKKSIVSAWVNKDGVPTPIFKLGGKGIYVMVHLTAKNTWHASYSNNGKTWGDIPELEGISVNCLAYGNGKFVAINSSTNKVIYSTNGMNWIEGETVPITAYHIGFDGEKFIMTGNAESLAYSSDGISWTVVTTDCTYPLAHFAFGNNTIVAIPTNLKMQYGGFQVSTDLTTWTEVEPRSYLYFHQVIFVNGKFFAAGYIHNDSSTQNGYIYSSEDGITWTQLFRLASSNRAFSIAYGNGKFVVGCMSRKIYTSDDGVTWTTTTLPSTGSGDFELVDIKFVNDRFIAVADGDYDELYYSFDGLTWVVATIDAIYGNPYTNVLRSFHIAYGEV